MRRSLLTLTLILGAAVATPAAAQKPHAGHRASTATSHAPRISKSHASHSPTPRAPRLPKASLAPGARDSRGRLERSAKAKDDFLRSTGHPHGWPGHVVDHVVPLACGGADAPSNMQWQTTAGAKAKDKVERRGCKR